MAKRWENPFKWIVLTQNYPGDYTIKTFNTDIEAAKHLHTIRGTMHYEPKLFRYGVEYDMELFCTIEPREV